jgi:hypothetical protein
VAAAAFLRRDDPAALTARGYLARVLVRRGRSGEAESIDRDLLADRVRVQGDSHIDTLATRHDRARVLGARHPGIAAVRHELAQLTGDRG